MNNRNLLLIPLLVIALGCKQNDAPTGVSQTDVEGVWSGAFNATTLLGRSLSGDVTWQFDRKNFDIQFLNPPAGQAEQISGDWKFAKGRIVLTLRSSFPIAGDVGTTDSLFVSILNNQMSMQTSGGSQILLQKIRNLALRLRRLIALIC